MKRSTKTISIILIFFLIIAAVIIGRTMIGNHFKKKFSKRPPPGIIVTEVVKKEFAETIETFGTAISKKSETFKIKKDDLFEDLKLKDFVKKGDVLIKLKSGNIIAIIFPLFNLINTSPFLTKSFNFKSSKRSSFFILKVSDFFEIAVPNVSIVSANSFFTTSVTIIPGGGLLLNFFLK